MKNIIRTEEEIAAKIEEITSDDSNFVVDNYGSEAAGEGFYEITFSKYSTAETFARFVKWLTEKEEK